MLKTYDNIKKWETFGIIESRTRENPKSNYITSSLKGFEYIIYDCSCKQSGRLRQKPALNLEISSQKTCVNRYLKVFFFWPDLIFLLTDYTFLPIHSKSYKLEKHARHSFSTEYWKCILKEINVKSKMKIPKIVVCRRFNDEKFTFRILRNITYSFSRS